MNISKILKRVIRIFMLSNQPIHLDEASSHLRIDFIPFYTKERQHGLKKGVSMQAEAVRRMKSELIALHQTFSAMEEPKYSQYKSFINASDDKLNFVTQQLTAEQIPYHDTENGFAVQECYAQRICEIERTYKVPRQKKENTADRNDAV